MIGSAILAVIALMALLAPLIAPDDPYRQDLMSRTIPPIWHATGTWEHALGTDSLGRDYLTRIMYGGRIALIPAFGVVQSAERRVGKAGVRQCRSWWTRER